jgi:hypothetical protein
MEQRQSTAMLHLTAGVEETYITHWFVKEGERVQPSDPLVTLRHPHTGLTFTLRAPLSSLLTGAVLQQILRSEGTSVSATEVLAVLTSPTSGRGRTVAQLRTRRPAASPYTAEMSVGLVVTSSSRIRDHLFTWFPRFHRFYFSSYPLLPLLNGGVIAIIGVLSALQIPHLLAQMSNSPTSTGSNGIFLFLTVAALIPLAITTLAYLIIAALRLFLMRHP